MAKEPTPIRSNGRELIRREKLGRAERPKGDRPSVNGVAQLTAVIEGVTRAGGLISLRQSGDGGVLLITVLHGDTKLSIDCHTRGDLLAGLDALAEEYSETTPNTGL